MINTRTSSMSKDLLNGLRISMAAEHASFEMKEQTPAAQIHKTAQDNNLQAVKSIGRSGDHQIILTAEKALLINELRLYGNSPGMKSSLRAALQDLELADKHTEIVKDPKRYAELNELFQRPKNRRGGLPYDEARQFFSSHNTRLLNLDRSRLSETEKKTINARRSNIRVAELAYIALQQKALGIEPKKDKGRDREMSR